MPTFKVPYAKGFVDIEVPAARLAGVLESRAHHYTPEAGQEDLVRQALANPINSPRLRDMAQGKNKIVIITSDHTRPVPSKITMPLLLDEIRAGNPQAEISILIATGFHRLTTREELIEKFGHRIVDQEHIVIHDSSDLNSLTNLGTLPSGGALIINKLAVEADLLVAEGFIEPHFFAGFSGGRKSVLPGIASRETVLANHSSSFIASPYSRTGNLDKNPLHIDMLWAAEQARLAFILNVVIDADKRIIKAFAGHREQAHSAGCEFVKELAEVNAIPAEIVVTTNGGYPLDQNIYQTVKGMTAAEATCKQGGVIIILSACNDGHGGEDFYRWMAEAQTPQEVTQKIMSIPSDKTIPDQWEAQVLARVLEKFTVILVSDQIDPKMVTDMQMLHASDYSQALQKANELAGEAAKITVIPDGIAVIVA